MSDHLDTASVAGHKRWLIPRQCGIVEGIFTSCVRPTITLVTVYRPSWNIIIVSNVEFSKFGNKPQVNAGVVFAYAAFLRCELTGCKFTVCAFTGCEFRYVTSGSSQLLSYNCI